MSLGTMSPKTSKCDLTNSTYNRAMGCEYLPYATKFVKNRLRPATLMPEALAASRSSCKSALVLKSRVTCPHVVAEYADPAYSRLASGEILASRLMAPTLVRVLTNPITCS